nr:hypothetical protein Iba_chr04aCG9220 [Ipomoea batatas]GMC84227.1 hypothetical protein Iba_chr04cCG9590 [Ipomoea batatas]GMC88569.1 hypothetical protein Iba_chr04eCG11300 [Ipomoea batatas]
MVKDVVLTDAGFIHPPVRSEPSTWRVTFDRLEIQVFMKELPGICLESPSEMNTIMNVKHPSVRAPRWMSTFSSGPRPMSGNVSRMSLTPFEPEREQLPPSEPEAAPVVCKQATWVGILAPTVKRKFLKSPEMAEAKTDSIDEDLDEHAGPYPHQGHHEIRRQHPPPAASLHVVCLGGTEENGGGRGSRRLRWGRNRRREP